MTTIPADASERRVEVHARPTFNLVDEPWIRVRLRDGSSAVMSLRTVYTRAGDIAVLDGESPTQDTAVFRLLMAILIRALRLTLDFPAEKDLSDVWTRIHAADNLSEILSDYLDYCAPRFDLFDPAVPFYQVADLETAKGEYADASVLIPDVGPSMFSTRTHDDARVLDAASAARWLVRLHAYDLSGIKSGALGDARVKDGKGYPIGTGWAGAIGSIMLTGPTLRDSLLLNLPVKAVLAAGFEADVDLPPWEREPDTPAGRGPDEVQPNGVIDLLTWQQRRVRLFPAPSAPEVVGVLICNGDKIARANRFDEPYAAQRHSAPQSKKAGYEICFARQLDPELTVWRGIQSVFVEADSAAASAPGKGRTAVPDRPAPVLEQLRRQLGDVVESAYGDTNLGLSLTGIAYGTQDAVIEMEMSETLPVSFALLTAAGRPLRRTAITAVDRVLSFRGQMRWFFRQLLVSAGDSPEDYPEQQVSAWLDDLQLAFVHWLSDLGPHTDAQTADLEWRKTMWTLTRRAIERGVEQAGPRAAIGRIEETETGTTFHSSARYETWIRNRLAEATGATFPTAGAQKGDPADSAEPTPQSSAEPLVKEKNNA
ncbi:type I-E CRISPR-associated protein Cse1/CasA [Brevibacterium otitidis]|uniref:Type I-E CRISPR-associated protein Cse1/CasA n=1 Tax=Brevibacterium otitidis TaxID=53364 RepID=A0ABV5X8A6_9MICO|nr:hypothetical protein GCM10023233_25420 [Brevibacterium otitidis]